MHILLVLGGMLLRFLHATWGVGIPDQGPVTTTSWWWQAPFRQGPNAIGVLEQQLCWLSSLAFAALAGRVSLRTTFRHSCRRPVTSARAGGAMTTEGPQYVLQGTERSTSGQSRRRIGLPKYAPRNAFLPGPHACGTTATQGVPAGLKLTTLPL